MFRAAVAALLLCDVPAALSRPLAESDDGDVLTVQTYDWAVANDNHGFKIAGAIQDLYVGTPSAPAVKLSTRVIGEEPPVEDAAEMDRIAAREQQEIPIEAMAGRKLFDGMDLKAVWDRQEYRKDRFDLQPSVGEHPCFAGFAHMVNHTDRCQGWVRTYPPVGDSMVFLNTGVNKRRDFTLKAVVGKHINVWLEEGSTALHEDLAIKAAHIYTNQFGIDELRPAPESESWMEHECKVMGSMPFMYTCSDRINILVQECQVENAWVMQSDYLRNYPGPATAQSPSNHDIIFYMCQELLDANPNPYAAANTFAHELAHVIQGGFGFSFNTMTEGGATWLEGPLLKLAPRPMVYAWGFNDWNRILAAHLYANTKELNSRKFYQIHGMFLSYLSQPELLGDHATSALQNYESFDERHVPWGRSAYDYFLKYLGSGRPTEFEPLDIDIDDSHNAFSEALLNYRVAMVAQCIVEAERRPTEPEYQMPESVRERPYWDCSSFPTYWSADCASVDEASAEIFYGGAAVFRLMAPENPTIGVSPEADPNVRTKVLVSAGANGEAAEVVELGPGETVAFDGVREIYIVQVNVDPKGEVITPKELWKRTHYRCSGACEGGAWWAGSARGLEYDPNQLSALQTSVLTLPDNTDDLELTFAAMWDMEGEANGGNKFGPGCGMKGYDGVQVRAIVYSDNETDGAETVVVLTPEDGYGLGPGGGTAIAAFAKFYGEEAQDCETLEGWAGSSREWRSQRIDLQELAGMKVRFEWLFASDGSEGGEGFWLSAVAVRSGASTVYAGLDATMTEQQYLRGPQAGDVGPDGIPVIAAMPNGYHFDRDLVKAHVSRSAAWSASWDDAGAAAVGESGLQRAYLGWSYKAPVTNTKTARLHPGQEACVLKTAPFQGRLRTATLFTLVDKIGVSAVSLSLRAAAAPHAPLDGVAPLASASPGVADPGMHRFVLENESPVFNEGDAFFMCVGIAAVKPLPADDPTQLPFLHLPITRVRNAGKSGEAGATTLLQVAQDAQAGEILQTTGLNPWNGHTFVMRSEFVEAADLQQSSSSAPSLRGAK